ncbi:MAG TPA: hypothetical protein PKH77_01040 [Anaerolineae bacterium]|nr:hypothetical protein [Anaerolineae bacterium]
MQKKLLWMGMTLMLLTGCAERVHTPRLLPEWGRAARVGVSARPAPVGLVVAPDGSRVALAWPTRNATDDAQESIHLLVLSNRGATLAEYDFPSPVAELDQVQLLSASDGASFDSAHDKLHLLWLSGKSDDRTLWYAPLPSLAAVDIKPPTLTPQALSSNATAVRRYRAATLPSGDVLALWTTSRGALQGWRSSDGEVQTLLDGVQQADFAVDKIGQVHVTWSESDMVSALLLYHAVLDPKTLTLRDARLMTEIGLPGQSLASAIDGPVIGLDEAHLYLSWTQRVRGRGVAEALYLATFPLSGDAGEVTGQPVPFAADFPPTPEAVSGLSPWSPLPLGDTNVRQAPWVFSSPDGLLLALPVQYSTRSRTEYQPTLVPVRDGRPLGYLALTWTDATSLYPVIAADAGGQRYVAWVDAPGDAFHYPVYLSSTAPALHSAWQHLTLNDYGAAAWDYVNRVTLGLFMLPLILVWLIVPCVWLLIMLARGYDTGGRGYLTLTGAALLYIGSKYLLTFPILTYLPGLEYLPPTVGRALIYALPVALLLFSAGVVALATRPWKRPNFSVMRTYLSIILIDFCLSVSVYAIGYSE